MAAKKKADSKVKEAVAPPSVELKTSRSAKLYPIVAVGASAGGIEAVNHLLQQLPPKPGIAIVVVMHQERKHASMLPQIFGRSTAMSVVEVKGGETIEVDHVYIAPPDSRISIEGGRLKLAESREGELAIDSFLRTLADDQPGRAIAVILSGAASDGTVGAGAIKAAGGITFAQDRTAKVDGMPHSAIASGAIDFVLPVDEIADELVRIAKDPYIRSAEVRLMSDSDMTELLAIIHRAHDIDFTNYKPATIERRVRRRMALHKRTTIADYLAKIREDPHEVSALYNDLLIRVTNFFRDPEVFDALKQQILPELVRDRDSDPIRIWVPGCATGEEVYSLAILTVEFIEDGRFDCPVQIFGTDISETAIDQARSGVYSPAAIADISEERRRRFFSKVDGAYRVSKPIRDCCIFARQNLTKDPPFSRLDLISCRNVMIYLGAQLQRKVMAVFHYALRPDGFLLLGNSETIGSYADLFAMVDRKHKIYRRKHSPARNPVQFDHPVRTQRPEKLPMKQEAEVPGNLFRDADRVLLSRYAPTGVLINENLEILQFRGRTSAFLEPPSGSASFNLLKMAREGLLAELRAAIHASRKNDVVVRREGIRVKNNGNSILVNVEVIPFVSSAQDKLQLVVFEEALPPARLGRGKKVKVVDSAARRSSARLESELEATREYLQSIIEEQEAMNEELRSANEEIQSSNEELQSTNEELETAKEELQSSNEELTTLNEELENRNHSLAEVNNDLLNLLASVDIPIVMLDAELKIRRFNPGAQRALNLIPGDVGRPINDMKTNLIVDDVGSIVGEVIETLETREIDVRDRNGRAFSLRVRPYRTTENKIDGAVLVLIELNK